ncbi:MAG TPA: type II toxin-antitoxin system prevent-host-death family antitoxin [Steroidobacteraceae bacterium]|nr:type II toxin-antitoxin system prevent-host-death family antitoxin [Steroidobacteraceae bacterium]
MKAVGVRELKNSLSEYLRQVRAGESVLVTDRGQVVAELAPPGYANTETSLPSGIRALARKGLATLGCAADATLYQPMPRKGPRKLTALQLLEEERGSR